MNWMLRLRIEAAARPTKPPGAAFGPLKDDLGSKRSFAIER